MSTAMTPVTIERLAFVRYLFSQGLAQVMQPEPFSATAVLSFHDAVEQFLRLAADHLGVPLSKGVTFSGYWKELDPVLPSPLPSRGAMERLNEVRVKFKHYGIIPSSRAIEQFQGDATTFFTDAVPLVFGISFSNVDMINLVARPETVELIRDAQTHADAGDLPAALAGLRIAFTEMLDHYSDRGWGRSGDSPFSFGPALREYRAKSISPFTDEHQIQELSTVAIAIQRAMRMIALGIDYNTYSHFEILAPESHLFGDMKQRYTVLENHRRLTDVDYQFCRNFVIESSIKAAKADATLRRTHERRDVNRFTDGAWPPVEEREWTGPAPQGA